MRPSVRFALAALAAAITAAAATHAQPPGGRHDRPRHDAGAGRMSGEDRQRLREDVQRQHAHPRQDEGAERERRYAEWQRLSPEQREGIRREMRDANRDFDRRR